MQILEVRKTQQQFASRRDIGKIFGYKDPTRLLQSFREVADENPNQFKPHTPYIKNAGMETLYSVICFAYYLEFKDVVETRSRLTSFKKELPRLRKAYLGE